MSEAKEKNKNLKALKKELSYKEKLLKITNSIHAAKDLDEIFLHIQDQILELFDTDKLTIYAADLEKNELFSKYKVGNEVGEIRVKIDKNSIAGFAAFNKTFVNIEDAYNKQELLKNDPELNFNQSYDVQSGYRTKQVLASPIMFQGELLGVVQLINKKSADKFAQSEISSIKEIAQTLSIAFYNQSSRQLKTPTKFSYLVQNNLITEQELDHIIIESRKTGHGIISILRKEYGIDKRDILDSFANFYDCPFIDYDPKFLIDKTLLRGLSTDYFMKNLWTPFRRKDGTIEVLVDDPTNIQKIDHIKSFFNSFQIRLMGALSEDIIRYLQGISRRDRKGAFRISHFISE